MISGKKGLSLIKLWEAGFRIPAFIVIEQKDCSSSSLQKIVEEKLPQVNFFAVRSSFVGEDDKNKSFAGYFYTALGVTKENLEKECQKVIVSYKGGSGEVILQEFINSDTAGVIFSNAGNNKMVINSNLGLCQPVVDGKLCDEFIIDRTSKRILSKKIEKQKEAAYFKNNKFQNERAENQSLSDSQVREIVEKALEIEKLFNMPQDIEFCFYKQQLLILQSRPITKTIFSDNEKVFYDNANIAESYSGTVLPLTLSFVQLIYSEVYKDLLCASGVPRKKVEQNGHIFNSLVANFYGKLYYNMNSWYEMMAFLPGYKRNKKNFELMISSNVSAEAIKNIAPGLLFSLKYYLLVAGKLILFPITAYRFKIWIKKKLAYYSSQPIAEMSFSECEKLFKEIQSITLKKWYVTVENDTALMTVLGKMHSQDKGVFNSIRITTHTVSANQINELGNLSSLLMADRNIALAVDEKNKVRFLEGLAANKELNKIYTEYFTTYGGRFANELKLESDDLSDDFEKLSALIKSYNKFQPGISAIKSKPLQATPLSIIIRYFATNREEMRLLRSNMFSVARKIFLRLGKIYSEQQYITSPKDIFYLSINEVFNSEPKKKFGLKNIIANRKKEYLDYNLISLPSHFSLGKNEAPKIEAEILQNQSILHGSTGCSGTITGKARVFSEFGIPDPIDFDILVAKHTDPGWVPLIGLCKGLIVEYGGVLSHASIVSRELGIPTVVGASGATTAIKTGDIVELNGDLGTITIKSNEGK
jgi:pyruvate,water dikinase